MRALNDRIRHARDHSLVMRPLRGFLLGGEVSFTIAQRNDAYAFSKLAEERRPLFVCVLSIPL